MAGLKIDNVGITPNPVDAGNQIKISVGGKFQRQTRIRWAIYWRICQYE